MQKAPKKQSKNRCCVLNKKQPKKVYTSKNQPSRQRMAVYHQKQVPIVSEKTKKTHIQKIFCIKFWSVQMLHFKQWHTLHGSNMICAKFLCNVFSETRYPLFLVIYGYTLPYGVTKKSKTYSLKKIFTLSLFFL